MQSWQQMWQIQGCVWTASLLVEPGLKTCWLFCSRLPIRQLFLLPGKFLQGPLLCHHVHMFRQGWNKVAAWARMVIRAQTRARWHVQGMLLWLLRQSQLRFLPYPYPAVSNVQQWRQQAELMVRNGALSRKHVSKAEKAEAFSITNLAHCRWLRDRMGWRHAFVEDPMMEGMLLARSTKGSTLRLKQQVLQEAQREAKKAEESGEREQMVRQFLGPRGGLPSLRGDLIKLAALLHIPVEAKVTVEQLKAKIRPMVHSLKGEDSPQASGAAAASKSSPARPKTPKSVPSSPENSQVVLMRQMMEQKDVRFKHILDQALQQVMNAQQLGDPYQTQPMMDVSSQFTGATVSVPSLPTFAIHTPVEHQSTLDGNPNLLDQPSEADWARIHAEEKRALYEDRMMAIHGPNEEDWGSDFSGKS